MTLFDSLAVHRRDGFNAAVSGRPASDNPWKPGTVGHAAWSLGWDLGRVARPVVRLFRFVSVLAVVMPRRRS